jgi:hypothetical protein
VTLRGVVDDILEITIEEPRIGKVRRCRLTASYPVLNAPMVSALRTIISLNTFNVCFQFQLAPLQQGGHPVSGQRGGAGGGSHAALGHHPVSLGLGHFKLSVGVTCHPYLLEIEGLFTQGWRAGRTFGVSVDTIFEMDSSDRSNGIRYHTFDTRFDTEFNRLASPTSTVPSYPLEPTVVSP